MGFTFSHELDFLTLMAIFPSWIILSHSRESPSLTLSSLTTLSGTVVLKEGELLLALLSLVRSPTDDIEFSCTLSSYL